MSLLLIESLLSSFPQLAKLNRKEGELRTLAVLEMHAQRWERRRWKSSVGEQR